MLQFHYNVVEKHVKHKYTLPYGATDSFVYNIKHPDIYEWIEEKTNNILIYHFINEKVRMIMKIRKLGCFKYELNGCAMSDMLGLSPKHYALSTS